MQPLTRINTCVIIVTYNPDSDFKQNIFRHLEIVDKVIIVDNHSLNDIRELIPDKSKVVFIFSSENKGIAWGLNQGLAKAVSLGYEYVLTFDQDSCPVRNILDLYNLIVSDTPNLGLLGTSYTDRELFFHDVHVKKSATVITSGALHKLSLLPKTGYYDESLFIDSVDFDFALRVKAKGFEVLRIKEPLICHHLGKPIKKYGIKSSNHSSFRRYYMARNHVIITKRYWMRFPLWILKKNIFFIVQLLKMIVLESDKRTKICQTIKGFKDAVKN